MSINKNKSDIYLLIGPEAFNRVKEVLRQVGLDGELEGRDGVLEGINREIVHVVPKYNSEAVLKRPLVSSKRSE